MQHTDLFRALLIEENLNARGNPTLSALLYAFCPAAAGWWLAGAAPEVPFDPVWESLSDFAGEDHPTLKQALERRGFEGMLEQARAHVGEIAAFRRQYGAARAPELNELFTGGKVSFSDRFGNNAAIAELGGDWDNFFAYVRTWAYLVSDWARDARIAVDEADTDLAFLRVELGIALPGIKTVYLPAWLWTVKQGYSTRSVIGLLTEGRRHDQLRFSVAGRAGGYRLGPTNEKEAKKETAKWRSLPEVYAFNLPDGSSQPADLRLPDEALVEVILGLHRMADKGPWPPARALDDPSACASCGFKRQCFTPDGSISPAAVAKLTRVGMVP